MPHRAPPAPRRPRRRLSWAPGAGGVALALACARGTPPAAVPNTPAGRVFRVWLDAYNAADSARLDAYARRYEPGMSVHAQLVFRAQTGPYAVASVERSEPRLLEVTLRTRADSTVGFAPLTVYGALEVAGGAAPHAPRARTTLTLVDRGAPPSVLAGFGGGTRPALRRVRPAERAAAVDSLAEKVGRNYVRPDVARRVADSLRVRQARGAYDGFATAVGFAQQLDRDLRALGGDPQLSVTYAWQVPLPPPTPTPPAWRHCGFDPPRVLAGGVAYVPFYGFGGANPTCGHDVAAAMQRVAGARALILDLRENGDESRADMAYLASYLVAGCTHLGDAWDRRSGRTAPLHTRDGLPGPAFGGTKPLVLLTSTRTFAAAEELAYSLRHLGRATLVGERTGGGAYTTAAGQIGEHLLVRIPVARAVSPITGTNWQAVGVEPDVPVPADEALATAQRLIRAGRIARLARAAVAAARRLPAGPLGVTRGGPSPAGTPGRGVRFEIDTLGPEAGRGLLSRVAGAVEFAGGRGRLDVTAVSRAPAVSLAGVTIREPLARPGDYYLFDNTGFVLVRPAARTFSRFEFTRTDFNHTGALLAGAFLMRDTPIRTDTLPAGDAAGRRQHAPLTVHWHMQPRAGGRLYARGWLEVADAPAVEAGVARWFEVAAALATRPGGLTGISPDGLDVTTVVMLHHPGTRTSPVTVSELLAPRRIAVAAVDPLRLVLPAGYRETRWPGFEHATGLPASSGASGARWRTVEAPESQRARAACRQAWLPDALTERRGDASPAAGARAP